MTAEVASRNDKTTEKNSASFFMMAQDGRLIYNWIQDGRKVYETDLYGGILNSFVLGVNCAKVVRHRTTTVVETYTVEE